jgi:hypothetical protein
MQQVFINLFQSKQRLMVVLRWALIASIAILGILRLRLNLLLLGVPDTYLVRDSLTYFLMAKAIIAGESPYLPLNDLASKFIGSPQFYQHPGLTPPFGSLIILPLGLFSAEKAYIAWFCFELICLALVAILLTVLWKGHVAWVWAILLFDLLLAWFPVMVDLMYGQLSILLTLLVLAAFLALRKGQNILSGVLIGLTVAIKFFTWPILIYFGLKKNWRAFFAGCITIIVSNLLGLIVIGKDSFITYYLHVIFQDSRSYYATMNNFSLWSVGYRLFTGSPASAGYLNAPPLVNLPWLAPIVSAGCALAFFIIGMYWVIKSNDQNKSFAILICILVAISPISMIHYHIMLIFSLFILWGYLARNSFPKWQTFFSVVFTFFLLLANEQVGSIIRYINLPYNNIAEAGGQISFLSSLLIWIPMISVVILATLLWYSGSSQNTSILTDKNKQMEVEI